MFKNRFIEYLSATVFVMAVVGLMTLLPNVLDPFIPIQRIIENLDLTDIYYSRLKENEPLDTNIIIVNIASSRSEIAEQLNIINEQKPAVIGIDAYFLKRKNPIEDFQLSHALSNLENCVMASYFINTKNNVYTIETPDLLQLSLPEFKLNHSFGFINFSGDGSFQTIRIFNPSNEFKDTIYNAFAVEIASKFNAHAVKSLLNRKNQSETINFSGSNKRFIFIDTYQIFDSSYDKSFMKDKIILLGYMGSSFSDSLSCEDKYFTPMNHNNISRGLPDMYGIVIHANIISMILNGNYINVLSPTGIIILAFILCYLNIWFFEFIRKKFPNLYGGELKIFLIFEFMAVLFVIYLIFEYFHFKINVLFVFFVILLSQDVSEIYFSSFTSIVNKLKGKIR